MPELKLPTFVVVGRVNKGKSSIVAALTEDRSVVISRRPGTTREANRYEVRIDGEPVLVIIDTPGFEEAPRALHWLRQQTEHAAERAAAVRHFLETFSGSEEFEEECRLLEPLMEGAAALYVVDGSVPYESSYDAELELLKWTGQPRLALLNRSGPPEVVATWKAVANQYCSAVREFDAMQTTLPERLALIQAFGALRPDWAPGVTLAVEALARRHRERLRRASGIISELLLFELTYRDEQPLRPEDDRPVVERALSERFHQALAAREQSARREVEAVFALSVALEDLEITGPQRAALDEAELFSEETWRVLGLPPRALLAGGAVAGALTGGTLDAFVGGASFMVGSVIGAAVGAGGAWWKLQQRTAGVSIANRALGAAGALSGARRLIIGPHPNPNYGWVILDRALLHLEVVRRWSHARRSREDASALVEAVLREFEERSFVKRLDEPLRRELQEAFERVRRDAPAEVPEQLRRAVAAAVDWLDAS